MNACIRQSVDSIISPSARRGLRQKRPLGVGPCRASMIEKPDAAIGTGWYVTRISGRLEAKAALCLAGVALFGRL